MIYKTTKIILIINVSIKKEEINKYRIIHIEYVSIHHSKFKAINKDHSQMII